ncbi:uncharacterized protein [Rutidosis leptorrhynchoides]|uniref:uncharacterized protein n=1 Tax=Rutidosis leptorrhynchoides TaxID=125765 RepID=UPI003A9A20FD
MAWAKWDLILASFDKGGLNVGSLKAFNLALIFKWRWRYLMNPDDLWVTLIKSINGDKFEDTHGTSLWSSIVDTCSNIISNELLPGKALKMQVGNGLNTSFWHDIWTGQDKLANRYNRLYHLECNKNDLIANKFVNATWCWTWSRPILSGRNFSSLFNLQNELMEYRLTEAEDQWVCLLSSDHNFYVKLAREHIDNVILHFSSLRTTWNKILPRKDNVFLWRYKHDYLPLHWNLSIRGLDVNTIVCPVCNLFYYLCAVTSF